MPNNIRSERTRAGMTQGQLADAIDVDESTVRRWESDAGALKACHLRRMADVFDCSIDYLLGLTDERVSK